jgi:hypothetical protein
MILASRGLSLSVAARASKDLFRHDPRFHVPPNLYHALDRRRFSPSIHQLFALSQVSNYRLVDWLAVFGVILDDIPRLQIALPARYTTVIDDVPYDDQSALLSFERFEPISSQGLIRPLLESIRLVASRGLVVGATANFIYAKIGSHDAFAYPELVPGSIVRIDTSYTTDRSVQSAGPGDSLFLVEHASGLVCSRLYWLEHNRVVLCPIDLPFAQMELELEKHARIIGRVDFEFRPTRVPACARVSRALTRFRLPTPLGVATAAPRLDQFIRRARQRSGLTFREASAKSSIIAKALGRPEFFCAPGSLSDYETTTEPPRHIHKMFSLCVLYSLNAWEFMRVAGLNPEAGGKEVMPNEFTGRASTHDSETRLGEPHLVRGEADIAQFPFFFGTATAELLKMPHVSIRDIFLFSGPKPSFHPYFQNVLAIVVDRRRKRILTYRASPLWAQPSYVLLGRDGNYLCTSCAADGRTLVVRPFSNGFNRPVRLARPQEIEVVGTVVGILRRHSSGL